jgi:hypothetical protein
MRAIRKRQDARKRELALHPLRFMRWTPPQQAFLADDSRFKILCLGQQLGGKTTVGLADTIWRCLGSHPYIHLPPRPVGRPFQAWIVCYSEAQSLQIQAKLWALLPKDQLHPATVYKGLSGGFMGKHTSVTFKNGATIFFKTTKQGPQALASGTVDHVQVDEPTAEECWQELKGRVRRTNGTISATLTPINAPTEYLREEVDKGILSYHQFPLTQQNATPQGSQQPLALEDGTLITDEWIAGMRAETPEAVRDTVLDGRWEERGVDRYFDCFVQRQGLASSHVSEKVPTGKFQLCLGIDHGDRPGKQIALLIAVQEIDSRYVRVWVLDEYVDDTGQAQPEQDAQGILDMLGRWGWGWENLDFAMGDRVHLPKSDRRKSNRDLTQHLCDLLRVRSLKPRIFTAKRGEGRGKGSVGVGARWLYLAMARPGAFSVQPRCKRFIEACNAWKGPGPDSPEKDPIDAARYGLDKYIFGNRKPAQPEIKVL